MIQHEVWDHMDSWITVEIICQFLLLLQEAVAPIIVEPLE
uniref:Uncharacterized protein n=1 Tax=viral metagenome TaxID=1070528 RepID=A0A6C0DR03_9ZZZZ